MNRMVFESDGYPLPKSPTSSQRVSTVRFLCTFVMMDVAATSGYVASALCRAVIFAAMIADVVLNVVDYAVIRVPLFRRTV